MILVDVCDFGATASPPVLAAYQLGALLEFTVTQPGFDVYLSLFPCQFMVERQLRRNIKGRGGGSLLALFWRSLLEFSHSTKKPTIVVVEDLSSIFNSLLWYILSE